MRFASSLLYGGMLVDAENADYQDYKRLLLRCPICGKEVHLVREKSRPAHKRVTPKSKRIVEVKASTAAACFSHFDGIVDDRCQRKIASFSRKDIERRQTASRGQRLRFFQRRFWECIAFSHQVENKLGVDGNHREWLHRLFGLAQPQDPPAFHDLKIELMQNEFIARFPKAKDYLQDLAAQLLRQAHTAPTSVIRFHSSCQQQEISSMVEWVTGLELDLHIAVVQEAIDYLCTRSAQPLLKALLMEAIESRYDDQVNVTKAMTEKEFAEMLCRDLYDTLTHACGTVVSCLCLTRWAEAIQHFENEIDLKTERSCC